MIPIFDGLRDVTLASVAARMILSVLCGGLIGMEREYKRRPAGFRTHILICAKNNANCRVIVFTSFQIIEHSYIHIHLSNVLMSEFVRF